MIHVRCDLRRSRQQANAYRLKQPFTIVARDGPRGARQQSAVPSGSARRPGVDHFLSWRRKVCVLPSLSPRSNCTHVPAQFELVFQT